jgi:D-alanyl-D-alanine endopeptidase (penicillin-binding protein 7)
MPVLKTLQGHFYKASDIPCIIERDKDRSRSLTSCARTAKFCAFCVLLVFSQSVNTVQAGPASAIRTPRLRSEAVIVQDQDTDEFLLEKKAQDVMPIASITKLMTAMVILDSGINMGMPITISELDKDTLRNSRSHLYVGSRISRMQAVLLALMASENRAAHALARTFPGGKNEFVKAMNRKAAALGLTGTRFEDSSGLSDHNVSSAQDLCRLVNAAYRYPLIRTFSTRKEFILKNEGKKLRFVNTNSLVHNDHWVIGLSKTGYIQEAGRCLVMQASLVHRPIVIVLLNASGTRSRIDDVLRIKRWLERIRPAKKTGKQDT